MFLKVFSLSCLNEIILPPARQDFAVSVTQVGCEHYSKIRDSLIFLQNTVLAGPCYHLFLLKDLIFLFIILLPIFNYNFIAIK